MASKLLPNNMHPLERVVRVALGIALVVLAVTGPKYWWGWIGVVPILTGLIGSCPAYTIFGFSTCPAKAH